uniref:Uncharacterized protein n=1 Tax=Ralstonia solanacearum TaxID=305 RepID=A0A0S4TLN9_RALSL|nr:conserved protein of unknown function [Ralstonia solanacearum]
MRGGLSVQPGCLNAVTWLVTVLAQPASRPAAANAPASAQRTGILIPFHMDAFPHNMIGAAHLPAAGPGAPPVYSESPAPGRFPAGGPAGIPWLQWLFRMRGCYRCCAPIPP